MSPLPAPIEVSQRAQTRGCGSGRQREIGIWPFWICPVKTFDRVSKFPLYPVDPDTVYLNFGFWDLVPSKEAPGVLNRKVEKMIMAFDGIKMLYSSSYFSRKEFAHAYNL